MTASDLWLLLYADCFHEVHLRDDGRPVVCWIPAEQRDRLTRLLDAPDCYVSAVPRTRRHDSLSWGDAPMLWALLLKPESTRRLQAFRPAPTFVWRDGRSSRRLATWSLSRPLSGGFVLRATERLAYHLGALRRAASPAALIPSPFTGRWAPEFESAGIYTPRQIVGQLRDAPDPHGWKAAA